MPSQSHTAQVATNRKHGHTYVIVPCVHITNVYKCTLVHMVKYNDHIKHTE